jgi:membrane-associated protein
MHWLDPKTIIESVGLIGVIAVVFAESGLFFGFFLPGDSLLFTAGLLASQGYMNIVLLVLGCIVAAIAGDTVGYIFGKKAGPRIFSREDSFLFHKKHALRAQAFYERYGAKTIFLARFVPVVRTFAPIVAGVGSMPYGVFARWNVLGGLLWAVLLPLLGFFLGHAFPGISRYLDIVIIAIIVVSFVPIVVEWLRERRRQKRPAQDPDAQ